MAERIVARWEARGGKQFLELYEDTGFYRYRGNSCMGFFGIDITNDEQAIAAMQEPWGPGVGAVTVLTADFPSTKRVL